MLGEAHQILGLIRFVAKIISGVLKWIRRPHQDKPLSKRRVVIQRVVEIERTRSTDQSKFAFTLKSYRSEEIGLTSTAHEGRAIEIN
jgi:hypothetical protein